MGGGPYVIVNGISIHAPRVGSDPKELLWPSWRSDFNPRSPCGERLKGGKPGDHL